MCGICGVADFSGARPDHAELDAMVQTLRHRGPDDRGVFASGPVGLGHARLSIIDLSSCGHQPMRSADGAATIAFNGEVYNFESLRAELESAGSTFRSRSDTEVVLEAYLRWGIAAFRRLEGMFALALWDTRSGELHLVRDRFGIKPLYYHLLPDGVVFGSEIKAVLASGRVPRRLGLAGLHEYMWYGNALGDNTVFEGIRKLAPGSGYTFTAGRREQWTHWRIEDVAPIDAGVEEAAAEVRRRLESAVRSHLVGDVPVGLFLSGGIDSSALTAFASRHYSSRIRTFSAGFDFEKGVNELPKARRVAEHYGTDHHEVRIAGRDMRDVIERLVSCHDEPFADAANIPLYLLCEQLRGSVKVVLQGDGGDEIFGGYRRYNVLAHERLWRAAAGGVLRGASVVPKKGPETHRRLRFLMAMAQPQPAMRMALLLTVETLQDSPTRVLSAEYREALGASDPFARYAQLDARFASAEAVQKMLFTDTSELLPNAFLEKVDKSTMAHGIEVRVPFLDNRLTEYALSLPSKLKVRRLQKKWILRRALRGIVPDWVLDAPKTGFGVPYEYWLRGPLADYMKSVLLDPQTRASGLFDETAITRTMSEHIAGARNHGFLLWKALQLALWHRAYVDAPQGAAVG